MHRSVQQNPIHLPPFLLLSQILPKTSILTLASFSWSFSWTFGVEMLSWNVNSIINNSSMMKTLVYLNMCFYCCCCYCFVLCLFMAVSLSALKCCVWFLFLDRICKFSAIFHLLDQIIVSNLKFLNNSSYCKVYTNQIVLNLKFLNKSSYYKFYTILKYHRCLC